MGYYCFKCKRDIEERVYQYSLDNYDSPLCMDCQDRNDSFNYNMIKGRIAEALIEQLFLKMNYKVYRYGMENTIPGISKLLKNVKTEVAGIIRRMPDLVVQDENNNAYFIEVKFSGSGDYSIENLKEEKNGPYPFKNAFFVVVSKKHIKCLSYERLSNGERITEEDTNYLGDVEEFKTNRTAIKEFCKYATKFFAGV